MPLHVWSEEVFRQLGDCFGQVVAIDECATLERRVNILRLQMLLDQKIQLPRYVALDVDGVRFFVQFLVEKGDCGGLHLPKRKLPEKHPPEREEASL